MGRIGAWTRMRGLGRDGILLLGAVALLVQVFAWTVTMPGRFVPADLIPICTEHGTDYARAEGDALPPALPEPAHHPDGESCPLCPLIGGLSLPPPLIQPVLPQAVFRHGPEALPGALVVTGWFLSTLQARAPPV